MHLPNPLPNPSPGKPPEHLDAYLPLVRATAARYARTGAHHAAGLEFADLVSHGAVGLAEAARRFDPSRGVAFATFAHHHVRGAMLDALRKDGAWQQARTALLPDLTAPRESIEAHVDLHWRVGAAVSTLAERDRAIVRGVFFEGCALDAIGRARGLSRGYACRLLHRALARLRAALTPEVA